jgi:hypothetical protein
VAIKKPVGAITRGTTNPNRLRRIDRFVAALPIVRSTAEPIVVDLGFGASPITAIELQARVSKVNPRAIVVGIEIDRERVERALPFENERLRFGNGGFEVPLPRPLEAGRKVELIRALNVLRQYDESEVLPAWQLMQTRLTDDGLIIDGTCDEIGRLATWVSVAKHGPQSLTISLRLVGLEAPSKVAERLPKILIHKNVAGQGIHNLLSQLDAAWAASSPLGVFSPQQRWVATCQKLLDAGWPIENNPKRWRLGELTVAWHAVAPK